MNEQIENQADSPEIENWEKAFEALAGQTDENAREPLQEEHASEGADGGQPEGAEHQPADQDVPDGRDDGLADGDEVAGVIAGDESLGLEGITQAEIDAVINDTKEGARNRAIQEVADAFIRQGVRNKDGRLGATIDDPDICKRDKDGVPTFYNPETGRPFTGDNPRRQAMEWIKDYNQELADKFNSICAQREAEIMREAEPRIQTLRFQSTYEKLDPIRQGMLDDIISDYEVKDSDGDVIGYSCDLNRALDVVNRQIAHIQGYAKNQPKPATGPAMDMKTSSGANTGVTEPNKVNSLAEAMELEQNRLLENLKNGRK